MKKLILNPKQDTVTICLPENWVGKPVICFLKDPAEEEMDMVGMASEDAIFYEDEIVPASRQLPISHRPFNVPVFHLLEIVLKVHQFIWGKGGIPAQNKSSHLPYFTDAKICQDFDIFRQSRNSRHTKRSFLRYHMTGKSLIIGLKSDAFSKDTTCQQSTMCLESRSVLHLTSEHQGWPNISF